jgi:hypothetical protein
VTVPSVYPPETDQYLSPEEAVAYLDAWANRWNYPVLLKPKGLGRPATTAMGRSVSMSWGITIAGDKERVSAELRRQTEQYRAAHAAGDINDKQGAVIERATALVQQIVDGAPDGSTFSGSFGGHTDADGSAGMSGMVTTSRPMGGT